MPFLILSCISLLRINAKFLACYSSFTKDGAKITQNQISFVFFFLKDFQLMSELDISILFIYLIFHIIKLTLVK